MDQALETKQANNRKHIYEFVRNQSVVLLELKIDR